MDSEYQLPLQAIGMVSPRDEDDMYDGVQWSGGRSSDKCNLIINYLPQDFNDNMLRVILFMFIIPDVISKKLYTATEFICRIRRNISS